MFHHLEFYCIIFYELLEGTLVSEETLVLNYTVHTKQRKSILSVEFFPVLFEMQQTTIRFSLISTADKLFKEWRSALWILSALHLVPISGAET